MKGVSFYMTQIKKYKHYLLCIRKKINYNCSWGGYKKENHISQKGVVESRKLRVINATKQIILWKLHTFISGLSRLLLVHLNLNY